MLSRISPTLVTDYENDRLRLTTAMAVRFALALDVSWDELLHPKTAHPARKASRKVLRRASHKNNGLRHRAPYLDVVN